MRQQHNTPRTPHAYVTHIPQNTTRRHTATPTHSSPLPSPSSPHTHITITTTDNSKNNKPHTTHNTQHTTHKHSVATWLKALRSSLFHGSSLARSCADGDESCAAGVVSVSAASGVAALPARRSLTYVRAAANACGEVARGSSSCSDTTLNSLKVQRSTSYNPQGVVALNSRRKVRQSCRVRSRLAEQIVDMSPALAAGTYQRSASSVHD